MTADSQREAAARALLFFYAEGGLWDMTGEKAGTYYGKPRTEVA